LDRAKSYSIAIDPLLNQMMLARIAEITSLVIIPGVSIQTNKYLICINNYHGKKTLQDGNFSRGDSRLLSEAFWMMLDAEYRMLDCVV